MPSSQAHRQYAAQSSSASTHCVEPHPPGTRPCLVRDCPYTSYWKVGPWSKVKQKSLADSYFHKNTFDDLIINLICEFWIRLLQLVCETVLLYVWMCLYVFVFIPVLADLWGRSDGAQSGVCDLQRSSVKTLPSFRKTWVSSCMPRQRMWVKHVSFLLSYPCSAYCQPGMWRVMVLNRLCCVRCVYRNSTLCFVLTH